MSKTPERVFSFDAETNGLYGPAFSIAAVVYEYCADLDLLSDVRLLEEKKVAEFVGRCPIKGDVDSWLAENVLPRMGGIVQTHSSYQELLGAFIAFYKQHVLVDGEYGPTPSPDVDVIVHCGTPVEARLFIDAVEMGLLGTFEGPSPLKDIGALPGIGSSVDRFLYENSIVLDEFEFDGGTHNPLYDSVAAYAAYAWWLHIAFWDARFSDKLRSYSQ
jgi:hypothetical protein